MTSPGTAVTPAPAAAYSGTLRLGTRRSPLAIVQSELVADRLRAGGVPVDLVEITTAGDRSRAALASIGGTGVFVSELRRRLVEGDVDLAVHSLKDLPTQADPTVRLAAVPPRADARDGVVASGGRELSRLPSGARIGTGSPRRAAQLRRLRPDLVVEPIRGNVDTRLRLVTEGDFDAVILAVAGLDRLGRSDLITELLEPEIMLPAPGQGALAVECRSDDATLGDDLQRRLDDPAARAAVTAERALLARLEAGCTAPVGALAEPEGGQIRLTAAVVSPDGRFEIRRAGAAPAGDAERLGLDIAEQLLAAGAAGVIGEER